VPQHKLKYRGSVLVHKNGSNEPFLCCASAHFVGFTKNATSLFKLVPFSHKQNQSLCFCMSTRRYVPLSIKK